jgi:hypothetical protein
MVVVLQAGDLVTAAGQVTWSERGHDLDGPFLRAIGTDADGHPVRLFAIRSAEADESTFVFVQDGRSLVVERLQRAGDTWLSLRLGRDRLTLEQLEDPLLRNSTLRYTLPDGSVHLFRIADRGEIEGDRSALERAFGRHQALIDQAAAFVAAIEDRALWEGVAGSPLASPRLAGRLGKFSDFSRCVDECAADCTLQCAAECNLGIFDPAGILCAICRSACLTGCSAGCSRMWSRE